MEMSSSPIYIVAINAGTKNNPGWNCGGTFINKSDAEKYSLELAFKEVDSEVILDYPWTGTRSYLRR